MKKVVVFLCVFFITFGQYFAQSVLIPNQTFKTAVFYNEFIGFRFQLTSDLSGVIQRTTDAGKSWLDIYHYEGRTGNEDQLICIDSIRCVYANRNGEVISFVDGNQWIVTKLSANPFGVKLQMPHPGLLMVYFYAYNSQYTGLFSSTDYGKTWEKVQTPQLSTGINTDMYFTDKKHGWYLQNGKVSKTIDGGKTWTVISASIDPGYCLAFSDSLYGLVGMNNGKVAKTTDGGSSWSTMNVFTSGIIRDIVFTKAGIWVSSSEGNIGFLPANQSTWQSIVMRTGSDLQNIYGAGDDWCYAGRANQLFRYDNKHQMFYTADYDISVKDTLVTISWESAGTYTLLITYTTDNGLSWKIAASNYAADNHKFSFPIHAYNYKFKIVNESNGTLLWQYPQISININRELETVSSDNITMMFTRDGFSAQGTPAISRCGTIQQGFFYPVREELRYVVYMDGFLVGGYKHGEVYLSGATSQSSLLPGRVSPNGECESSVSVDAGIWKMVRNIDMVSNGTLKRVYQYNKRFWPGNSGAPFTDVNKNGFFESEIDEMAELGDEMIWFATNDLNYLGKYFYNTKSMGIEVQCVVFMRNSGVLKNVVFKNYTVFNRSSETIDSMFFSYWSDPDIGDISDDYMGVDTVNQMVYSYNADNYDAIYGNYPPAVGYTLLGGPIVQGSPEDSAFAGFSWVRGLKRLKLSAANVDSYSWSQDDPPPQPMRMHNWMRGFLKSGAQVIDQSNGVPTKFFLAGDPVAGTGWYEGAGWPNGAPPGDRIMIMSAGPVSLAPGQRQEFTIATIIDSGVNHLNSITKIRELVPKARDYYYSLSASTSFTKPIPMQKVYSYILYQNYPNPFNAFTKIRYEVPIEGKVTLTIYDILGRAIETLVDEVKPAGNYETSFSGNMLSSGVYFYRLQYNGNNDIKKMILLK